MRGEVTFSGTRSFKNSADRSEEQQKEKNPHFYPESLLPAAGPHTIADGSNCTLTPLKLFYTVKTRPSYLHHENRSCNTKTPCADSKVKGGSLWLAQSAVHETRYCEIPALFPLFSAVTQRKSSSASK